MIPIAVIGAAGEKWTWMPCWESRIRRKNKNQLNNQNQEKLAQPAGEVACP